MGWEDMIRHHKNADTTFFRQGGDVPFTATTLMREKKSLKVHGYCRRRVEGVLYGLLCRCGMEMGIPRGMAFVM